MNTLYKQTHNFAIPAQDIASRIKFLDRAFGDCTIADLEVTRNNQRWLSFRQYYIADFTALQLDVRDEIFKLTILSLSSIVSERANLEVDRLLYHYLLREPFRFADATQTDKNLLEILSDEREKYLR